MSIYLQHGLIFLDVSGTPLHSSACGCVNNSLAVGGGGATKYRYYGKDRYCGKLVLKPFLILSIGKYRSIDIFDNTIFLFYRLFYSF